MLIGPPLGLIQLGVANHSLNQSYFVQYPRLYPLIVAHTIVCVLLFGFLFYAGLSLWRKWRHALSLAKISLVAVLLYALAVPVYPFLMGAPPELAPMLSKSFAKTLLPAYAWTIGWLLYLMNSRRVREIFPRAL